MMDTQETLNDFTPGSIIKKLIHFMLPILGALILQAMYGAVDLLIVGQFGTNEGISAISTGSNMINLITFLVIGLTVWALKHHQDMGSHRRLLPSLCSFHLH